MMGNSGEERRTLADIIMEKIHEKEAMDRGPASHPPPGGTLYAVSPETNTTVLDSSSQQVSAG